ncbi:MAG TPA: glycosyltransferase [Candidatus Acidoferrum sp.]|nr:glycosyltransferase [Candidatus Acidoferrum sp.]
MRVLKTVQSYFPFQERGGTVFKVRAIARGLACRGHHVTVLTADLGIRDRNSDQRFQPCPWGWCNNEDGVETVYLSTVARFRAVTINPGVMRFCASSLRKFDLVHVYGLYDFFGPAAGIFCRRNAIPYILEPMGMYRPIIRNLALKRTYQRVVGASLAKRARFVIATSELERNDLVSMGIDPQRIVLRRNGIDVPDLLPERGGFRDQLRLPKNATLILFLGRIVSKKRPDLLIQAFADWYRKSADRRNSFLIVAGPKEGDRYVRFLRSLAQSLGISERVLFIGPLYDDQKWRAYRDADVFVLPSENENFGNTAAEAVSCGTPVIVTDRCGVAPFVEQAGLIVPVERAAMANALEKILGDRAFNHRCRSGCAEVAARLSWDAPLDELEQLYRVCCPVSVQQPIVAA